MNKKVLSVLVDNTSGVLNRVAGLFSRRGYNIDSLTVGVTQDPRYSRMTIVVTGDDDIIEQIIKQIEKLVDVNKVEVLEDNNSVCRELILTKVKTTPEPAVKEQETAPVKATENKPAAAKQNKPAVFLNDSERFLGITGPLSMLPQLLGCLGGVFTAAGVGDVIAQLVEKIVPKGNVNIGIIVYAIGMVLFTMIMGNAFAAITVMTVGIGAPFVLAYGANPVVIGMLALTCGYCGTLLTPMAANFNILPVAILNMKDRWGAIKNQVLVAIFMLVFQICYMIVLK